MSNNAQYNGPRSGKPIRQISELANGLVDPILSRRAGINTMLIASWEDIVGPDFADCTRPEKIAWPRRASESVGEEGFEPGTLTVACEGARALFFSHQQDQMIDRVNGFFGFPAVARIRIVQKAVRTTDGGRQPKVRPLNAPETARLAGMLDDIEDPALKTALERLGRAVIGTRGKS